MHAKAWFLKELNLEITLLIRKKNKQTPKTWSKKYVPSLKLLLSLERNLNIAYHFMQSG